MVGDVGPIIPKWVPYDISPPTGELHFSIPQTHWVLRWAIPMEEDFDGHYEIDGFNKVKITGKKVCSHLFTKHSFSGATSNQVQCKSLILFFNRRFANNSSVYGLKICNRYYFDQEYYFDSLLLKN